MNLNKYTA